MASSIGQRRLQPRKTPRQTRSVETRARILAAARTVFAAQGYAAGTTNRIAATADLSVGSLYQYFPNKDSILVELVREHIEEGTREVLAAIRDARSDDLPTIIENVVTALVAVHTRDRRLHQVLFEESPRPPALLTELRAIEDSVVALIAARLEAELPYLGEPELATRIIVTTIESLVHRLVATNRPLDADLFSREVTRLVCGYLVTLARDGPRTTAVA